VRKFQVPSIFAGLTVEENLKSAYAVRREGARKATQAERHRLLETTRLSGERRRQAGELSHGQKQWLELALVLATGPRLVLLDEPSAGMTRAEKTETVELIKTVRRDMAVTVLVIEHDMDFVEALDCPVSVMMMGRMVASGSFAEIREDKLVREAYLGPVHG
jgi:ABC-type uncharacterized transport system ATPase subunit